MLRDEKAEEEERESFLISYHGEYSTNGVPEECEGIVDDQMSQCLGEWDCKCQDVANNTYFCIRKITQSENSIYCRFEDNENFIEVLNQFRSGRFIPIKFVRYSPKFILFTNIT